MIEMPKEPPKPRSPPRFTDKELEAIRETLKRLAWIPDDLYEAISTTLVKLEAWRAP